MNPITHLIIQQNHLARPQTLRATGAVMLGVSHVWMITNPQVVLAGKSISVIITTHPLHQAQFQNRIQHIDDVVTRIVVMVVGIVDGLIDAVYLFVVIHLMLI